jgi:hypothetical protein
MRVLGAKDEIGDGLWLRDGLAGRADRGRQLVIIVTLLSPFQTDRKTFSFSG